MRGKAVAHHGRGGITCSATREAVGELFVDTEARLLDPDANENVRERPWPRRSRISTYAGAMRVRLTCALAGRPTTGPAHRRGRRRRARQSGLQSRPPLPRSRARPKAGWARPGSYGRSALSSGRRGGCPTAVGELPTAVGTPSI